MVEEKIATIDDIIAEMKKKNRRADTKLILKAYEFAKLKHGDQKRKSGEPYIIHPVQVAYILAGLELDESTICAALLHDLLEDTEHAINYYKYSDFSSKVLGEKYILLYGLFESFYIQYDAVKKITNLIIHLLKNEHLISKNDFMNEFKILNKIKEYRNDIAGHPAYRDKDKYSV